MEVETRRRTTVAARVCSVALLPLVWVERAQGGRRLALLAAYAFVAAIAGLFVWRAVSLRGLPDIGESFDVAEPAARVLESESALLAYNQAIGLLKASTPEGTPSMRRPNPSTNWEDASAGMRAWIEANQEAIQTFVAGSERTKALVSNRDYAGEGAFVTPLNQMDQLAQLVLLEGSRLEREGDLAGAWKHYRAVLRASRHIEMFGGIPQRWNGQMLWHLGEGHVTSWTEHPQITAPLLRRALDDIQACVQMTPGTSLLVQNEYYRMREQITHPQTLARWTVVGKNEPEQWWRESPTAIWIKHFLNREPERSLRVLRLITAGQIAQCDRPAAERAPVLFPEYMIHAIDSHTPPALRSIPPEKLKKWAESADLLPQHIFGVPWGMLDGEQTMVARAAVPIAERCYLLEHGTPPKKYEDLVGPYLRALPEGYASDEVPLGTDPDAQKSPPNVRKKTR